MAPAAPAASAGPPPGGSGALRGRGAAGRGPAISPARARRERRRAEERLAILRAAAGIFRRRGYARTGMREIALAAGLSAANLYHYFGSKDEILHFCQDRTLDQLLANLEAARRGRGPVAPRLRELAGAHVLCLVHEVVGGAAHFEVDALPPDLREAVVAKRDRYERGVRGLVALGIRRGELGAADAAFAARGFLGALNWTAYWFRPEGGRPAERVAEELAGYALAGLVGGGGGEGGGAPGRDASGRGARQRGAPERRAPARRRRSGPAMARREAR